MSTTVTAPPATTPGAGKPLKTATKGSGWRRWLPYVGIIAIVVYCLAPFYWMVVSSLRRPNDIFDNAPLPSPFSVDNYAAAFDPENGFARSLLNSLIVAGVTTVLVLIIGTLTAYALARLDFPFKRTAMWAIIATSMFPGISLIVPLFDLFATIAEETDGTIWYWILPRINNYQAMIIPNLSFALPLAVWNLTAFFRQMPYELEEAAQIDGCTPGQAFRKVILPLAAPGVFTTAIITFIAAWNEFIIALSMINDKDLKTAPVIVSQFTGETEHDAPFGTIMAAGVIVTIPLVIMVLFFQRRIVAGLTAGGVK